jgi:two-component system OmpR family response regulator
MAMDNTTSTHLLIVDDDREIRALLKRFFSQQGFRVSVSADGDDMMAVLGRYKIDLVVLDRMMPGMDGLSLCAALRRFSKVPVVMLTVLGEENDRIDGFQAGVDDYLTKPFNPQELLARVQAVLRRTRMAPPQSTDGLGHVLAFGPWRLDIAMRRLMADNGTMVDLSTKEFDLLTAFAERPGLVLTREQLLDLTSGTQELPFDRKIDMQVSRLRRKIEADPKVPVFIQTVRGGGYKFVADVTIHKNPAT